MFGLVLCGGFLVEKLFSTTINRHGCVSCGRSVYFTRHGACEDCEGGYYDADEEYARD